MTIDSLRLFRHCFFCKGRKELHRVEHPGYSTTFQYFHPECLEKVLKDPEIHVGYVDSAIQIHDQLVSDRQHEDELRQAQIRSINRAKQITGVIPVIEQVQETKLLQTIPEQQMIENNIRKKFERVFNGEN